jgi:hypothetical protein
MGIIVDKTIEALAFISQMPGRENRAEQLEAAKRLAAFMERHENSNDRVPRLQGQHMTPGGGKTLAVIIAAIVYAEVTGKKVIISTCTRNLRDEYKAEFELVSGVLPQIGLGTPSVGKWISTSSIASGAVVDIYRGMLKTKSEFSECAGIPNTREHIERYIEWFDNYGDVPVLSDWLTEDDSCGKYPLGEGEIDFAIKQSRDEDDEFLSVVTNTRNNAKKSLIILTTHALTVMNALNWGSILKSADVVDEGGNDVASEVGSFIFDEADTLPKVAQGLAESGAKISDMENIVDYINRLIGNTELVDLFNELKANLETIPKSMTFIGGPKDDKLWKIFGTGDVPLVVRFDDALSLSLKTIEKDFPNEIFIIDDIYRVRASINPIVVDMFKRPGTMEYSGQLRELTDSVVYVDVSNDDRMFGMKPKYLAHLIRQLWTRNAKQSFTFTSGTLISPLDDVPYENFKRSIGADYRRPELDDVWEETLTPNCGTVDTIVYAARTAPSPSGEQQSDGSYANPDHARFCAKAIIAGSTEGRSLVLFASNASMQMTKKILEESGHGHRLVVQNIGQNYHALIKPFADRQDAIYLGMNWEGINLRNESGTLIRNIFITKIPYSSGIDHRNYKRNLNQAILRMQQGIGRGLRSKKDRINLWLLDCRLPFPTPMVKIAFQHGHSEDIVGADTMADKAFRNLIPRRMIKRGKMKCGVFDEQNGLDLWDVNMYYS